MEALLNKYLTALNKAEKMLATAVLLEAEKEKKQWETQAMFYAAFVYDLAAELKMYTAYETRTEMSFGHEVTYYKTIVF